MANDSSRRLRRLLAAWGFSFLGLTAPLLASPPLAAQTAPRVLILNSYHYGFAWSDAEQEGFLQRMQEAYPAFDAPVEYLDTRRFPDPRAAERMKSFLAAKYSGLGFDLLVALDNPALEMLIRFRGELFPETPVVFAGISDYAQFLAAGRGRITGVAERQNVRDTLELALALHPHTRTVLVLDDETLSGRTSRREVESLEPQFAGRVRIDFLPPSTFAEAADRIAALSQDALVFIHSYSTDRAGQSLSLAESTRRLAAAARVPVYAGHETRLGFGIVGGYLLGGQDHGRRAAEIALRVLAGRQPETIPVDEQSTARPMFDYRQLKRFGIQVRDLPPDSLLLYRPASILDTHRELVIGTVFVLSVLVVLVLFLVGAILRRRRAEASLKENEERLRVALEGTADGIWDWNPRTGRAYFSPRYYTMLGYRPGEFPAEYESWRSLLHPEDREAAEEALRRALAENRPFASEFRLRGRDGQWRWVLGRGKAVESDEQGRALRVAGSHTDITERRRATEELDRFFTVALDLLCIADMDGFFRRLNPQWQVVLGYSLAELEGRRFLELVHPDDLAATQRAVAELQAQKSVLGFVNRYRRKDGDYRWIEWRSYAAGGLIYAAARDITERMRAEQDARRLNEELERRVGERTAQLEAANRELEAFTYSVSHDLRAPLRAIGAYARILVEERGAPEDGEERRISEVIQAEIRKMSQLIDSLLDFSRFNRAPIQAAAIDMERLAAAVFQELASPEDRRRVRLELESLPPGRGDPAMIRQVWVNLLSNALKFTSRREQAVVHVGSGGREGANLYYVRDNGARFDMRYQDKLFRVFQRLHSARDYEGSGIGLAIVQRVVQRHGGEVWAEGAPEQGATFYFTLPRGP